MKSVCLAFCLMVSILTAGCAPNPSDPVQSPVATAQPPQTVVPTPTTPPTAEQKPETIPPPAKIIQGMVFLPIEGRYCPYSVGDESDRKYGITPKEVAEKVAETFNTFVKQNPNLDVKIIEIFRDTTDQKITSIIYGIWVMCTPKEPE